MWRGFEHASDAHALGCWSEGRVGEASNSCLASFTSTWQKPPGSLLLISRHRFKERPQSSRNPTKSVSNGLVQNTFDFIIVRVWRLITGEKGFSSAAVCADYWDSYSKSQGVHLNIDMLSYQSIRRQRWLLTLRLEMKLFLARCVSLWTHKVEE